MNRREHRKEGDGLEGYEMPNKWVSATRTRTDLLCNIQPTLFSTGVTEPNHCFCVPSFSHFTALLRIPGHLSTLVSRTLVSTLRCREIQS